MTKRRIIATKISVTKQGEVKFFQVKLPFDTVSIIGIETAFRMRNASAPSAIPVAFPIVEPIKTFAVFTDGDTITKNSVVGELKLQSSDDSNVFYATSILDRSVKESIDNIPSLDLITERVFTHGCKSELEEVIVDGNATMLAGLYKDRLGEMMKQNLSYDVFLYVWYKYEKQESHDDQSCS